MTDTTYSAHAFKAAAPAAEDNLWSSLFKATPLYIFATAVHAALQASKH
jgi:hypothetical protein